MKLITQADLTKLKKNFINSEKSGYDPKPVIKLFTPDGNATWLITEIYPDGDTLFGLCDLGLGFPELGVVSLNELKGVRGPFGLGIERDRYFKADKTLSQYAYEAYKAERIVA